MKYNSSTSTGSASHLLSAGSLAQLNQHNAKSKTKEKNDIRKTKEKQYGKLRGKNETAMLAARSLKKAAMKKSMNIDAKRKARALETRAMSTEGEIAVDRSACAGGLLVS